MIEFLIRNAIKNDRFDEYESSSFELTNHLTRFLRSTNDDVSSRLLIKEWSHNCRSFINQKETRLEHTKKKEFYSAYFQVHIAHSSRHSLVQIEYIVHANLKLIDRRLQNDDSVIHVHHVLNRKTRRNHNRIERIIFRKHLIIEIERVIKVHDMLMKRVKINIIDRWSELRLWDVWILKNSWDQKSDCDRKNNWDRRDNWDEEDNWNRNDNWDRDNWNRNDIWDRDNNRDKRSSFCLKWRNRIDFRRHYSLSSWSFWIFFSAMCKLIFFNKLVQNIRRDDEIRDDDRDDDRDEINNEISRNENSRESSRDENSDLNTQMLKNVAEIIESIEIHVAIFHESAQLDTDSTSLRYWCHSAKHLIDDARDTEIDDDLIFITNIIRRRHMRLFFRQLFVWSRLSVVICWWLSLLSHDQYDFSNQNIKLLILRSLKVVYDRVNTSWVLFDFHLSFDSFVLEDVNLSWFK